MEKVQTYKALSGSVKLFGYVPLDLAVILITVVVFFGFTERPLLAILFLWLALYVGKKINGRKRRFIKSLFLFFITPKNLRIKRETLK